GHIHRGQNMKVGYFAQHQLESLDPQASPFLHIRRLDPNVRDQEIRNFIGRFGFSGDRSEEPVAHFSGGEKARVALAMIAWQKPNLLLLDEPTNHLDLEMRESLNFSLQQYEGAVILVSHDRYLLNATAEEFWWVRHGRVESYRGDLADYFQELLKAPATRSEARPEADAGSVDKKAQRQARAEQRQKLKPLRDDIRKAEKQMEALQSQLTEIENRLGDTTLYEAENKDQLQTLLKSQGELSQELSHWEEVWMQAQEALEAFDEDAS
ncbi:ATP-binding cassette domain-containing protein, partial [Reinekea blandensis]